MQVHSEKGSVTITKSKASPVKTIAQNPGPSGSAEKENMKWDKIHIKLPYIFFGYGYKKTNIG